MQDLLGGGGFFLEFGRAACREVARGGATRLLGWFGGKPSREIFSKWCNLVRFGVYFDKIWT